MLPSTSRPTPELRTKTEAILIQRYQSKPLIHPVGSAMPLASCRKTGKSKKCSRRVRCWLQVFEMPTYIQVIFLLETRNQ